MRAEADRVYQYMISDHSRHWGMDIEQWDWVPGVGIIAIMEYGIGGNQESAIQYVRGWVERNREKAEASKVINTMAPFAVFPELFRLTAESEYLEHAKRIVEWMLEEAPRTREGAFEHTVTESASFPEQVWGDTMFMAVLFLARYASLTGNQKAAEEALRQTTLHLRLLQDANTGLLYHGWNCVSGDHMSAARWARANAWIVVAVPEIVMELRGVLAIPDELAERYVRMAAGLRLLQAGDGLWHTVLDRPDFYKETSGSAGIGCGFLKGIRSGLLDSSYMHSAMLAVQGVRTAISSQGEVTGVSGGTPVMPSIDAYNAIPLYPTLYGQGLTLMLLTEAAAVQEISTADSAGVQESGQKKRER